jgi:AGZA family xanthine/uracil permease-like MFS transporter
MHGEAIGWAQSLPVAFSYVGVAGILLVSAKYAKVTSAATEEIAVESRELIESVQEA